MPRILLVWELGGAMGHLQRLKSLGKELVARGHEVILASRNLEKSREILRDTGVVAIQGPTVLRSSSNPHQKLRGFADVLAGVGFAEESTLNYFFDAWNRIFSEIGPDLVIADYAPMALLALRGHSIPKVSVGLGFYCPPDRFPFDPWPAMHDSRSPEEVMDQERQLTTCVNQVLQNHTRPRVERLSQIFNDVNDKILATYRELDPFTRPHETVYWGHWSADGAEPQWPSGEGPKVFAYLKPFAAMGALLTSLRDINVRTLVVGDSLPVEIIRAFSCSTIRFESQFLNMSSVISQCDLAITNGGHGVIASTLLAGKPGLIFPLFVEQSLNALAVHVRGAGRMLSHRANEPIEQALRQLLFDARFTGRAQAFASHYSNFTPGQQLPKLVDHLENLLLAPGR